jgi:hypothetical protein
VAALALLPLCIPLLIELLLWYLEWGSGVPVYLTASLIEVVVIWLIYLQVLKHQGGLLQGREQKILETVTTKME